MRKKPIMSFFVTVAVIASLALSAGNVFAQGSGLVRSTAVVSPYWQADSGSYTFVGVSHPSLSGMASTIGVVINAFNLGSSASQGSTEFTITRDSTTRVFIVATNQSATSSIASVSGASIISTSTNYTGGHLRITAKASNPSVHTNTTGPNQGNSDGFRDVTMLSFWGAIVAVPSSGFAMEFIGDLADSRNPSTGSASDFAGSAGVNIN